MSIEDNGLWLATKAIFNKNTLLIYNLFDQDADEHYYLGHEECISREIMDSYILEAFQSCKKINEEIEYTEILDYLCEHFGFYDIAYEFPEMCYDLSYLKYQDE